MQLRSISQTRILQLVFGFGFLSVAMGAVKSLASANTHSAKSLGAVSLFTAFALFLDSQYWILFPLIASSPFHLPGGRFNPLELGCISVVGLFVARASLHRDHYEHTSARHVLVIAPYFLWACLIFCMNPIGLHMFGSHSVGARNYFWLVLGFLTTCCLANMELDEKGLRWLFWGLFFFTLYSAIRSYFYGAVLVDESGERATRYYLLPFFTLATLLLCRYDPKTIATRPLLLSLFLLSASFTALSGKRSAAAKLLLTPVVLLLLRRKGRIFTIWMGVVATFLLAMLLVGQGRLYHLPAPVQRGLSFLPAKWDGQFKTMGFNDSFRKDLQMRAKEIIRKNPVFGRKGPGFDVEMLLWFHSAGVARGAGEGHAMTGNWHNKFWGMWADFGIVAPFSWYFFSMYAVCFCIRIRNAFQDSSYESTFFRYWFLVLFFDLIMTYGQSSKTPFEIWPQFGLLLALWNHRQTQLWSLADANDTETAKIA